jgi:multiple antibiotic resistance protein
VLRDVYGAGPTLVSITLNVLLAGLILTMSDIFIRLLGEGGSKAISKVFSLLLAAIAVMLMRRGITEIISSVK